MWNSQKPPTLHNGRSHRLHLYVVCLPVMDGDFSSFSIHKHSFPQPDMICKLWKRLRNAIQMGKLFFLPVRLRDANVPIS
jgi:hypothetical protein